MGQYFKVCTRKTRHDLKKKILCVSELHDLLDLLLLLSLFTVTK